MRVHRNRLNEDLSLPRSPGRRTAVATHSSLASRVPVLFHANHFYSETDFVPGNACLEKRNRQRRKKGSLLPCDRTTSPFGRAPPWDLYSAENEGPAHVDWSSVKPRACTRLAPRRRRFSYLHPALIMRPSSIVHSGMPSGHKWVCISAYKTQANVTGRMVGCFWWPDPEGDQVIRCVVVPAEPFRRRVPGLLFQRFPPRC